MTNVIALTRQPQPSPQIADEFGKDLFFGRQDPSDPEACQAHLFELYPDRLRQIVANLDGAMDVAGQMYLNKVTAAITEAV